MSLPRRMRAAVLHGREDLRVEEVDVPSPGPGELLVRTRAALTCGTDLKVWRRGYHARMLVPPALFGHELAGVVEAAGEGAGFLPGQRVVAANSAPCRACEYCQAGRESLCDDLSFWNGAYAEYALLPRRLVQGNVLPIPDGVGFREAALVEPLACVVRAVQECGIRPAHSVAVIGAGPIGLMFVRLASQRGASVVVAARGRGRLERATALGAATLVEAGECGPADLAQRLRAASRDGRGPDLVIEAVGRPETSEAAIQAVRKGGVVELFGGCPSGAVLRVDAQRLHYDELTLRATFHHTPAAVREALRLITAGTVDPRAFVTSDATLEELPGVFVAMARGGTGLKTAVLPWGPEEG